MVTHITSTPLAQTTASSTGLARTPLQRPSDTITRSEQPESCCLVSLFNKIVDFFKWLFCCSLSKEVTPVKDPETLVERLKAGVEKLMAGSSRSDSLEALETLVEFFNLPEEGRKDLEADLEAIFHSERFEIDDLIGDMTIERFKEVVTGLRKQSNWIEEYKDDKRAGCLRFLRVEQGFARGGGISTNYMPNSFIEGLKRGEDDYLDILKMNIENLENYDKKTSVEQKQIDAAVSAWAESCR